MPVKIIEFKNKNGSILRGVLSYPEENNDRYVVLMMGGFEGSASTERKFKILSDRLMKKGIASFRFDTTDCGLSDGDFYDMTVESLSSDLLFAIKALKNEGFEDFSVVGHSLASCAISLILNQISFRKIVLIAPALNQKKLLRLWFAQKTNKDIEISWENYERYFSEEDFLYDLSLDFVGKLHKVNYKYRMENSEIDYSDRFSVIDNNLMLLVQGDKDVVVPKESINIEFKNEVIVKGGDHRLDGPDFINWTSDVCKFLVI